MVLTLTSLVEPSIPSLLAERTQDGAFVSRLSWFRNLFDARRKVANWKLEYSEQRPDSSLGYRTPAEFARVALTPSYRKDVGLAHLENACGVYHFPTASAAG
jgi:Integrase core domain